MNRIAQKTMCGEPCSSVLFLILPVVLGKHGEEVGVVQHDILYLLHESIGAQIPAVSLFSLNVLHDLLILIIEEVLLVYRALREL